MLLARVGPPIALALLLTGCGSALVTTLQIGVDAAAVAVATATSLEASGTISTAEATTVITDSEAASNAFAASITELDGTDVTAVKFSKVASLMAGVVLQTTGLSPKAAALVAAIQAAVTTIIQQIQATPVAAITTAPSGANSFAGTVKPVSTKLSSGDKKKLKAIQAKIAVTQAQAAAWRAKHGK